MKIIDIEGLVVKEIKFKENSKIITVIGRDRIYSIIAKGALKPKNKLHAISHTLLRCKYTIYYKENTMSTLVDGEILEDYSFIRKDLTLINATYYLLNIFNQLLEEHYIPELYDLLVNTLDKLNNNLDYLVLINIIEVKLLKYLGLLVDDDIFEEYNLSKNARKLIMVYERVNLDNLNNINLSNSVKYEVDKFLTRFYEEYTGLYTYKKKYIEIM